MPKRQLLQIMSGATANAASVRETLRDSMMAVITVSVTAATDGAYDDVHNPPRAEGVCREAVDGVSLRPALVVGHAEVLELVEEVVAHACRAAVFEVVVDHHAGHPDEVADELQAHADDHEPDDLADLGVRQDGQEQRVDPVAFRLVREHAVDQDREGPCFKDADGHRHRDEHDEDRD